MGWSRKILRMIPVGAIGGLVVSKVLAPYVDALAARTGINSPSTVDRVLEGLAVFLTSLEFQIGLSLVAAFGAGAWIDKVLAIREKRDRQKVINLGRACENTANFLTNEARERGIHDFPAHRVNPRLDPMLITMKKLGYAVPKRDDFQQSNAFFIACHRHLTAVGMLPIAGHEKEAREKAIELSANTIERLAGRETGV